ncbi:L-threonine dehydratase biosynthetic IlvA [Defluviimonas aquaemixtae]|uniref:L-threonine dehydratase biosynthetic IlvA n=1 Tax=Albidovulum aquaemixtae TaxID=1542388 RepID=A0A2R8B2Y5_9RHOB|nr:threonine dehydratase [Defluviimonas aquaemixtae]SPH16994.1 L-threonine dehydratase biosynthetic IlvA [Defluviimonas aquaemixtae]
MQFTLDELEEAAELVRRHMEPTPQYAWPQLAARTGAEVWVKHENHGPIGAFKARGAITLIDWLRRTQPDCPGIITATRGNHGQAQARAATRAGLRAVVYVPHGNSVEKNAAMRAFGADLREFGEDFDTAKDEAMRLAKEEGLFPVPPFHRELVRGVATYALEFFRAAPPLDAVYVPIGCGSGICGVIAARDALGLSTEVVGVVSTEAACAKLSVEAGRPVETNSARTFADGMAVRVPVKEALDIYGPCAARILAVSEDEVAEAMRIYFADTHNTAEGAGAAPLAALLQEREAMRGRRAGVVLTGGNIDTDRFAAVLSGRTPAP